MPLWARHKRNLAARRLNGVEEGSVKSISFWIGKGEGGPLAIRAASNANKKQPLSLRALFFSGISHSARYFLRPGFAGNKCPERQIRGLPLPTLRDYRLPVGNRATNIRRRRTHSSSSSRTARTTARPPLPDCTRTLSCARSRSSVRSPPRGFDLLTEIAPCTGAEVDDITAISAQDCRTAVKESDNSRMPERITQERKIRRHATFSRHDVVNLALQSAFKAPHNISKRERRPFALKTALIIHWPNWATSPKYTQSEKTPVYFYVTSLSL